MSAEKIVGKISFWNESQGFGFCVADDPATGRKVRVFLHVKHFVNLGYNEIPEKSQEVKFRFGKNEKGLLAEEVELISAGQPSGSSSKVEGSDVRA